MEYMSQECYDKLVAELQHLIKVELPKARISSITPREGRTGGCSAR